MKRSSEIDPRISSGALLVDVDLHISTQPTRSRHTTLGAKWFPTNSVFDVASHRLMLNTPRFPGYGRRGRRGRTPAAAVARWSRNYPMVLLGTSSRERPLPGLDAVCNCSCLLTKTVRDAPTALDSSSRQARVKGFSLASLLVTGAVYSTRHPFKELAARTQAYKTQIVCHQNGLTQSRILH